MHDGDAGAAQLVDEVDQARRGTVALRHVTRVVEGEEPELLAARLVTQAHVGDRPGVAVEAGVELAALDELVAVALVGDLEPQTLRHPEPLVRPDPVVVQLAAQHLQLVPLDLLHADHVDLLVPDQLGGVRGADPARLEPTRSRGVLRAQDVEAAGLDLERRRGGRCDRWLVAVGGRGERRRREGQGEGQGQGEDRGAEAGNARTRRPHRSTCSGRARCESVLEHPATVSESLSGPPILVHRSRRVTSSGVAGVR